MSAVRRFPSRMSGGVYFGPADWRAKTWAIAPTPIPQTAAAGVTAINNRDTLLALVRRVGLGKTDRVTPALADQLELLGQRPVRLLVLNLLPSQPESALAAALTDLALAHLRAGLTLLDMALRAKQQLVAVDRHDQRTVKIWRDLAPGHNLGVKALLGKYPLAHPLVLLRVLCRRSVLNYAAPAAAGLLVVDPVTCWALGRAAAGEARFTHRPVQVVVQGLEPVLAMARIGEPLRDLFTRLGFPTADMECIAGGMLSGQLVNPADAVIEPHTDVLALRPSPRPEPSADCIGCGWCVQACPTALNPAAILAEAGMRAAMPLAHLYEAVGCIDCGLCTYLCPSRLPLAATIGNIKRSLTAIPAAQAAPAPSSLSAQESI